MEFKIIIVGISTILGVFGFIPYVKHIWNKSTKPHIFTWLIWTITQGTAVAGLLYGNGGIGAIPLIVSTSLTFCIVLLSIRNGSKIITKSDIVIFLAAISAIFVWWFSENPLLAVLMVSGIDAIGYIPTFRKSFHHPDTETLETWILFGIADGLSILALESYNFLTVSYLATITSANIILVIYLLIRRKLVKSKLNNKIP